MLVVLLGQDLVQLEMAKAGLPVSDTDVAIQSTPAGQRLSPDAYSALVASSSTSFGQQNTYSLAFRTDLQSFLLEKVRIALKRPIGASRLCITSTSLNLETFTVKRGAIMQHMQSASRG